MQKLFVLSFFLLITVLCYAQSKNISGLVTDDTNTPLPGAKVSVKNTEIEVTTDFDGNFRICVPDSLNVLVFQSLGFSQLEYKLEKNQNYVEIKLGLEYYNNYWYTVGFNIDPLNTLYGLKISNGYEEIPLIHFEDINSTILYYASFQTSFKKDYTIDFKLKLNRSRVFYKTYLEFQKKRINSIDFDFIKIEVAKDFYIRPIDFYVIPSIGFHQLIDFKNIGLKLGIQKSYEKFYFGASTGYYFDYVTYSAHFQSFLFKSNIGFRLEYENIHNQNFLTFGFQYSIVKEKLRKAYRN